MVLSGSPPQVRGKRKFFVCAFRIKRITPAGAGKTSRRDSVHTLYKGSPPQVRGKLIHIPPSSQGKRITPAGAGKTKIKIATEINVGDHPRRCGENSSKPDCRSRALGSPPQVRGKRRTNSSEVKETRITPAGAGKTRPQRQAQCQRRDHPRRCGENFIAR